MRQRPPLAALVLLALAAAASPGLADTSAAGTASAPDAPAAVANPTPAAPARQPSASGLAAAMSSASPRAWPIELAPADTARAACAGEACNLWQRLDLAVGRAAEWLADFPRNQLRFDAATMLSGVRRTFDSDALRRAFATARSVADRDDDNPRRRFWVPEMRIDAARTSRWQVPTDGSRVNTNRVVEEALYCAENGWRPETTRYVCGPMRDDGGYQSAHGLWVLSIARRNGCVEEEACLASLQAELAAAQPDRLAPRATLDIDLFAERLMVLLASGYRQPAVDGWAEELLALQDAGGSWGVEQAGERPYYRYHATALSVWALAEWVRRSTDDAGAAPAFQAGGGEAASPKRSRATPQPTKQATPSSQPARPPGTGWGSSVMGALYSCPRAGSRERPVPSCRRQTCSSRRSRSASPGSPVSSPASLREITDDTGM